MNGLTETTVQTMLEGLYRAHSSSEGGYMLCLNEVGLAQVPFDQGRNWCPGLFWRLKTTGRHRLIGAVAITFDILRCSKEQALKIAERFGRIGVWVYPDEDILDGRRPCWRIVMPLSHWVPKRDLPAIQRAFRRLVPEASSQNRYSGSYFLVSQGMGEHDIAYTNNAPPFDPDLLLSRPAGGLS